jgi:uncharacterized SAM-binding protein YcdF (DUF218 family)
MLVLACIATLTLLPLAAIATLRTWGRRQRAPLDGRVLVVLGAKVDTHGHPSPALVRRLTVAVALHNATPPVFCGGRGEAQAMAAWWARHVPDAVTPILEDASTTTDGNARHARALLGDAPLLVVTDDLHACRARAEFLEAFSDVALHHARTPGLPWRSGLRELGGWLKRGARRAQTLLLR